MESGRLVERLGARMATSARSSAPQKERWTWPRPSRRSGLFGRGSAGASVDSEQLHLEDERGAAGDRRGMADVAVRGVRGANERRLLADVHLLHALGPALDHAVQGELRRL